MQDKIPSEVVLAIGVALLLENRAQSSPFGGIGFSERTISDEALVLPELSDSDDYD